MSDRRFDPRKRCKMGIFVDLLSLREAFTVAPDARMCKCERARLLELRRRIRS
jgi:hypothetical protein